MDAPEYDTDSQLVQLTELANRKLHFPEQSLAKLHNLTWVQARNLIQELASRPDLTQQETP